MSKKIKSRAIPLNNREIQLIGEQMQPEIDRAADSTAVMFAIALIRHTAKKGDGWGNKRIKEFFETFDETAAEYKQHWKDDVFEIMAEQELKPLGITLESLYPDDHLPYKQRTRKKKLEKEVNADIETAKNLHEQMTGFHAYFEKSAKLEGKI